MLTGWIVNHPTGHLASVSDDGAKMEVDYNINISGDVLESGACLWDNVSFRYPGALQGDFEAELKVSGDGVSMGSSNAAVAIAIGHKGDADPDGAVNSVSRGHHTNTSAKVRYNQGLNASTGGGFYVLDATSVAWATATWIKIARVDDRITTYSKTLDGDPWTELATDSVNLSGREHYLYIMFRGSGVSTAATFWLYAFKYIGTAAAV